MNASRIDTHHHVVPPRWKAWLESKGATSGGFKIPDWTVDGALSVMEAAQIETAILSASIPGVGPADTPDEGRGMARDVNEFCARVVQENPGRFGYWALLTLPDVDGALAEATYALDHLQADGVVVYANSKGIYLGDPLFDPLFEELNRRKAVVFVHPGPLPAGTVPGIPPYAADFLLDTTRAAFNMVKHRTLERYPSVKIILSHGGGFVPYGAERLSHAFHMAFPTEDYGDVYASLRKFYFDLAGSMSQYTLPSLLAFADPSHLTYGSDYPYASPAMVADSNRMLEAYGDMDYHAINRGNAEALLPRLARRL